MKPKRFAMPIHLLVVIFHLKTSVNRSWSYCSFSLQYRSGAGTHDEPLRTSPCDLPPVLLERTISLKRIAVQYGALVGVFVIVAYFNKCANNLKTDILEINHRFI